MVFSRLAVISPQPGALEVSMHTAAGYNSPKGEAINAERKQLHAHANAANTSVAISVPPMAQTITDKGPIA
jgi:hypothetical protein